MNTARHTCNYSQFSKLLIEDTHSFRGHVCRISTQSQQKKYIKFFFPKTKYLLIWTLPKSAVQISEWNSVCVLEPNPGQYLSENLSHQNSVFLSNKSRCNASLISTLIGKLIPLLRKIVPDLEMIHYWTHYPASQYRNSIATRNFLVARHHETTWKQVMERGHAALSEEWQSVR